MWLITTFGFFSIVEDDQNENMLIIRARVYRDLENLRNDYIPAAGEVISQPGGDYPFCLKASREDLSAAMPAIIASITYPNFKEAVTDNQGYERAQIYAGVWMELYRLQRGEWQ